MRFPLRSLAVLSAGVLSICAIVSATTVANAQASQSTNLANAMSKAAAVPGDTVAIPGPLRSFLRMAGISQEVTPPEVLPMLARNVFLHGYEEGKETEFLILIDRYLHHSSILHDPSLPSLDAYPPEYEANRTQ